RQAPRLGDVPSPHGTFQEHAAHIAKWPAMLSSKGSQGTCIPRGLSTFLQCAFTAHMDHPIGWVPDAPYPHLMPTVWTDEWIPPRALLIPLPGRQSRDDLDRALDHPLDLRQGCSNHHLHLGKRLGRLHPIIADTLEALGHRVLHHPADKRGHRDSFVLHPLRAVRAVMV